VHAMKQKDCKSSLMWKDILQRRCESIL